MADYDIPIADQSQNGLMSSEYVKTLTDLNINAIKQMGTPSSGTINLNKILEAGCYYLPGTASYAYTNMPDNQTWGTLIVHRSKPNSGVIIQQLFSQPYEMYIRRSSNSGETWTTWYQYSPSNSIETEINNLSQQIKNKADQKTVDAINTQVEKRARLAGEINNIGTIDGFLESALVSDQWTMENPLGTLKIYAARNHQSTNSNSDTFGNSVYFNLDTGWVGMNTRWYDKDKKDPRTDSNFWTETIHSFNMDNIIKCQGSLRAYDSNNTLIDSPLGDDRESGVYYVATSNQNSGLPADISLGNMLWYKSWDTTSYGTQILTSNTGSQTRNPRLYTRVKVGAGDLTNWGQALLMQNTLQDGINLSTLDRPGTWNLNANYTYTGWGNLLVNNVYKLSKNGVLTVFKPNFANSKVIQFYVANNGYAVRYKVQNGGSYQNWVITYTQDSSTSITNNGITAKFTRKNNLITFKISGTTLADLPTSSGTGYTLGKIDKSEFLPSENFDTNSVICIGTANARIGRVQVTTAGDVILSGTSCFSSSPVYINIKKNATVRFQGSYFVD